MLRTATDFAMTEYCSSYFQLFRWLPQRVGPVVVRFTTTSIILVVPLGGCGTRDLISPAPSKTWQAGEAAAELVNDQEETKSEQGEEQDNAGADKLFPTVDPKLPLQVSLGDLIDLGLQTNPRTRRTWYQSTAQRAELGIARSTYYPQLEVGYQEIRRQSQAIVPNAGQEGNTRTVRLEQTGPYGSINFLLFDFGAREAQVSRARYNLIASSFSHNRAIQEVVLGIQDAFFRYVSLLALASAQEQSVKEAKLNLDAAEARRAAGVATRADVLQAQTELARAELELETRKGDAQAVKGAVLTAVGLPVTQPVEIKSLQFPEELQDETYADIEQLIAETTKSNPELLAAQARIEAAEQDLKATQRARLPSLRFTGRYDSLEQGGARLEPYSATLNLSFPLFTGFSRTEQVARSQAELEIAKASYEEQRQARMEALWRQHALFQSARSQVAVSKALVASATESVEVAQGRYREGVGSILDLLQAQRVLEQARASQISAQASWLLALAQLRFHVGTFSTSSNTPDGF